MLLRSASLGGGELARGGVVKNPGVGGPFCAVDTPLRPGAVALGPIVGGTEGSCGVAPPATGATWLGKDGGAGFVGAPP